jgi:hypothetical protein
MDVKPVFFPVSAGCVNISNPDLLFSRETGAIPGISNVKVCK